MNKPYVITYDLSKPIANYEKVFETIKSFGNSIRFQKSVWIVKTSYSPSQMYDKLKSVLDADDYIFICELQNHYYGWAEEDNWTYLKDKIFK